MLECIDVSLRYGSVQALAGASLTLSARATGAVIGPSGSGKSTLLRVITGLERPDAGSVRWAGAALDGVPAHQRGFGLMFQDYALFPHLDVAANIGFSLDVAGWPPATTERRGRRAARARRSGGFPPVAPSTVSPVVSSSG